MALRNGGAMLGMWLAGAVLTAPSIVHAQGGIWAEARVSEAGHWSQQCVRMQLSRAA